MSKGPLDVVCDSKNVVVCSTTAGGCPLDVVCDSKNVVVCCTTAGGWVQGILLTVSRKGLSNRSDQNIFEDGHFRQVGCAV